MLQRGVHSGTFVNYPRMIAPGSGEPLEWVEVSGLGTVYSTTAIRQRPPEPARNVALIDLDEGVRMMSRVEAVDALDVRIGMRVKAAIRPLDDEDGNHIVVFEPVEGGR